MKTFQLSLFRETWQGLSAGHHVIHVVEGSLEVNGSTVHSGDSVYVGGNHVCDQLESSAEILRFSLIPGDGMAHEPEAILTSTFVLQDSVVLMRLDQVTFPPGACAYRHTHPGPGIRYLLYGELELVADEHTHTVKQRDAWFEDADSPVRATASEKEETAFIRCMLLPVAFEELATINILNPADKARPMLQGNRRFIDQRVQLDQ